MNDVTLEHFTHMLPKKKKLAMKTKLHKCTGTVNTTGSELHVEAGVIAKRQEHPPLLRHVA